MWYNVIAAIALFFSSTLSKRLKFHNICLLCQFMTVVSSLFYIALNFAGTLSVPTLTLFYILGGSSQWIFSNIYFVAFIGKASKSLSEGFESTGVTTIISSFNLAFSASYYLSDLVLKRFNVKNGYYDRILGPQVLYSGVEIGLLFLAPLFLWASR